MSEFHQLVPAGGWRYLQGNVNLVAANRQDLVRHIRNHRKNNAIPEGDIEQDIDDQLLKRFVKKAE